MSKSLYRLLVYLKKGLTDIFFELNAKSIDFVFSGDVILLQIQ